MTEEKEHVVQHESLKVTMIELLSIMTLFRELSMIASITMISLTKTTKVLSRRRRTGSWTLSASELGI